VRFFFPSFSTIFIDLVCIGDLEGSTGLKVIHQKHPEVFIPSGIMERGNFSAAAGFGFAHDKFGVFSTFSAFLEMVISEITMARLNDCNVLSHFSHAGGRFFCYMILVNLTIRHFVTF